MKDTIFEIKQLTTKENITFHFQPNDQFDAIKEAIVRKFNNKRKLSTAPSIEGSSPVHLQHHIGGLPSPPVEEKKVTAILPSPKPSEQQKQSPSPPSLSSQELREKIQHLKDEKHRLFQLIKQMMMEEDSKKRQAKAEERSLQQRQAPPPLPPQSAPAIPPAQQQPKKKSRWGAPTAASVDTSPFYSSNSNQSSYFYPRPTASSSRYNSSHPYTNQQRPRQHPSQHHYSLSRPPYSR
ncbi:hypothetical protein MAM1_0138d06338 [Mucor ambiguus]|uniref:Uncharacterized protein n=1 Tax=Mucor ambiguus TaxID=91626 RepID=A0A0C9MXF5_9FUNG|nr:hypothetical protein MAM1_0138d06338 [Mucor ambiguus]